MEKEIVLKSRTVHSHTQLYADADPLFCSVVQFIHVTVAVLFSLPICITMDRRREYHVLKDTFYTYSNLAIICVRAHAHIAKSHLHFILFKGLPLLSCSVKDLHCIGIRVRIVRSPWAQPVLPFFYGGLSGNVYLKQPKEGTIMFEFVVALTSNSIVKLPN